MLFYVMKEFGSAGWRYLVMFGDRKQAMWVNWKPDRGVNEERARELINEHGGVMVQVGHGD